MMEPFEGLGGFGSRGKAHLLDRRSRQASDGSTWRSPLRRELVDAFHAAALVAGREDNRGPGPRPAYHESYYGAFVLEPDGNNVEAVCHTPA